MLQKIDSILQELCLLPSLSGHEQLVSNRMRECFQSYGLKVETDVLGNTITCIKGEDHTRRVMVSAHMDSPGLMVKTIDEDGCAGFAFSFRKTDLAFYHATRKKYHTRLRGLQTGKVFGIGNERQVMCLRRLNRSYIAHHRIRVTIQCSAQ